MAKQYWGADANVGLRDGPNLDAFSRLRVSAPETIFDSKQTNNKAPEFWDDQLVSGSGGDSVWSQDTASTVLSVDLNTAANRTRQTFMRMNYKPGKSQLVFMTGTLGNVGGGGGIQRCMGIYDDNNGLLFRDNEGVLDVVCRTSTSGTPVDNTVTQTAWNLDRLDGTGPSGITIDSTKSQIGILDYEWLGVGRVRFGFVFGGQIVYCHEFLNSNVNAGVYMSTPNLPLRYEIINDGTGVASELETICATVISEGGNPQLGLDHFFSTEDSFINANVAGTKYAVFGVRLKAANLDATVLVNAVQIMAATTGDYLWELILNPTIASTAPTWSSEVSAAYETSVPSTANPSVNTITNGHVLAGGLVKGGKESGANGISVDTQLRLGSAIDGTRDQIWLTVMSFDSNADIHGGLSIRDVT